jgi:hypothetical protein
MQIASLLQQLRVNTPRNSNHSPDSALMLIANALFLRDFPATRRFGRGSRGTALRLGLLADSDTFWADLDRTYINLGLCRAAHEE